MTTELIKRLREGVSDTGFLIKSAANVNATMAEAADALEAMQRELDAAKAEIEQQKALREEYRGEYLSAMQRCLEIGKDYGVGRIDIY